MSLDSTCLRPRRAARGGGPRRRPRHQGRLDRLPHRLLGPAARALLRRRGQARRRGRADRADARPRERHGRADRADKTLYDAAPTNGLPALFETLDGAKRIGVEEDHLNFARARALAEAGYELVPATELVMHLRAAKDAEEVEAVRRACAHIQAAYDELWASLKPGDTEAEVNARVAYMLARRGAKHPEPHILFGEHSAEGHGSPASASSHRATSSSPTSPRSSTATGATSRAAPTPGRRATGRNGLAGRPRGLRGRGRRHARRQHVPRRGPRAARDHRGPPGRRRLPARRRPRDRDRGPRAAVPDRQLGRTAARGHDLHRRARDLRLRARRDPARGRRAGRPRRPGMLSTTAAGATDSLAPRACAHTSSASSRGCRTWPSSTSAGGRSCRGTPSRSLGRARCRRAIRAGSASSATASAATAKRTRRGSSVSSRGRRLVLAG